jgi:uncharacterized OB-fold protein
VSPPEAQTITETQSTRTRATQADAGSGAVPFRPGVLDLGTAGGPSLAGSRCPGCGAHFFPARHVCSGCLTEDLDLVPLSRTGTIYTFTVVRQSTPDFTAPYLLGYVDLPEGVRVLGLLVGLGEGKATIGMTVTLATQPKGTDADGCEIVGYCFRPAEPLGGDDG